MSSKRDHFVSQFYLRNFSETGKALNIFNLPKRREIERAALRDQCYRRHFYGPDKTIDAALTTFEGHAAPVIRAVLETCRIPTDRASLTILRLFLVSQARRTASALSEIKVYFELLAKEVGESSPLRRDLDEVLRAPAAMLLSQIPKQAAVIGDLQFALFLAPKNDFFLTSDNPVIRYNVFVQELQGYGARGLVSRGIQFFVPLNQAIMLCAFDPAIYFAASTDGKGAAVASKTDVEAMNLLQAVFAEQNLYFQTRPSVPLTELARHARPYRAVREVQLNRCQSTESSDLDELWIMENVAPNLKLKLNCLRMRKGANRIPLQERFGRRGKDYPAESSTERRNFAVKSQKSIRLP